MGRFTSCNSFGAWHFFKNQVAWFSIISLSVNLNIKEISVKRGWPFGLIQLALEEVMAGRKGVVKMDYDCPSIIDDSRSAPN